ncbi:uncharacterized protein LOC125774279 isoform X2 [Anopheles funestus]|uniref:uncharacterized protein LOC125774279 isoform X2 n=1 Tax=Anopheles funestus TaxID=62324 RepID=UPI0020C6761F|nr:uncharacterized protein LOC125774279 isoform X2 [Anopheles funestus]XP_049300513.1 uncharacterized protein LOC125774279 isoform X2 [Anopheles funestus]
MFLDNFQTTLILIPFHSTVQMSVLLVLTGLVSYSSLFVMDIIGRSTRYSFILALEQVFLAAFSLLLTVMGILVHMLVQDMNVSYRVLSVSMLISHGVLGVLFLLAKVSQMNQLADRWRVLNGSSTSNRAQNYRRTAPPARNNDVMEVTRRDSYTYRFVNPGASFGNEVVIPPNIRLSPSMLGATARIQSYIEPLHANQSSEPIVSTSNGELDGTAASTNGPTIIDAFESLPSSDRQISPVPSELSSGPREKPFRVNPITFRKATEETFEPNSTIRKESLADSAKPLPMIRRTPSITSDPDPTPSTSRQHSTATMKPMYKRSSEPTPSTSRQKDMEPSVSYKNGNEYVNMSRLK